eukprot:GILI01036226.1.p2 GENE.GILI01036226.1~~GILI01036226.1.p2  ORF type:complete len:289 (+),score=-21.40 GILI01036226.1:2185-3051(+)
MIVYKDIEAFNQYVGLPKPLDNDINIGMYDRIKMRLYSEPIMIDFYRISIKTNYVDIYASDYNPDNPQAIKGVFFDSPEHPLAWDVQQEVNGMYLQISKKLIEENRFLFQNALEYGQHEVLIMNDIELEEIKLVFHQLYRHYQQPQENKNVLISYIHVLISLLESFYTRQFSTDIKKYNHIVSEFQFLLNTYFDKEVQELPSVKYFAHQMMLSPNYLGDIIKHFTNKTAIETIQIFVIEQAKKRIQQGDLSIAEIAYQLGFEYPNYFAKMFKKHVGVSPTAFKNYKKP